MSYSSAYYSEGSEARQLNRRSNAKRRHAEREFTVLNPRKATVRMSTSDVIMMVSAVLVVAFVAIYYVSLQSEITNLRKEKSQLISQYESLKTSNDLYYDNMKGAIDLKEVERIAVEELGMKMAGKGQIIVYEDDLDDYVKQYTDIPSK